MSLDAAVEFVFGPLDPAAEFRYFVEVDGLTGASFTECSGMSAKREVCEVREGGANDYVHKLPGRITYGDITLRKGVMFSTELWDWFEKGLKGYKIKERDITIIQYSAYFNIPSRWYNVKDAFPVGWEVSRLGADSNQLAVESLTVTFKTIEVEDWSLLGLAAELFPI
jgi:phage tail-like protein